MFGIMAGSRAFAQPLPGGTLDPTTIPKYVQPLVIPPEMPKSTASPAPAADYDIAVRQFQQQILPGGVWNLVNGRADAFSGTTVWSYGRAEDPAPNITLLGGAFATLQPGVAPAPNSSFNYPAFTVEATSNVLTKVRWINDLVDPATGNFLPHLLPVDQTLHWANPPKANCLMGDPNRTDCETGVSTPYTGPVPIVVHVHGAHVQAHSDGYPEGWWLPGAPGTKGIPAGYAERGSVFTQADDTNTVAGSALYSYENSQPATTIWYHDHALGMTRLNVYAGPAGFWLIRGGDDGDSYIDDCNTGETNDGVLPGPAPSGAGDPNFDGAYRSTIREVPIAIQDRSFNADGSLFYPAERSFFDGFTGPYIDAAPGAAPSDISGIWNPEAFFNTMVVNGTTWPKYEVANARYRLRLLNGCNSRTLNLALFVVTSVGADGVPGTADDTLGEEVPFYQIAAEQGFLPKVVKITTGFATPLPGDGTIPADVAAPHPSQALLLMNAERADVIVDFKGMANGTRIRMINTAPDAPFGGFPDVPADPSTTGQVMDFIVNTDHECAFDSTTTPPERLVLPAEAQLGNPAVTRKLSLNELMSDQVCVEIDGATGAIVGTLFSNPPGDPNFLATCQATPVGPGNIADAMGPRQAQVGVVATSGGNLLAVPHKWGDAITETPFLNSTELWELYNTTADAHPIHLHLVRFNVVDREDLDATALAAGNLVLTGVTYAAHPAEWGYKDTVQSYPGQVTRIKAKFDIAGLYVWHCHIVEHEDNEMMRPFVVSGESLYSNLAGNGLFKWDGTTWTPIHGTNPAIIAASSSALYAGFTGSGLYKWDGTAWTRIDKGVPTKMAASGTVLYASFTGAGLYKYDGMAWSRIDKGVPTNMAVSGSILYASFTGAGLYKYDGMAWSRIDKGVPTNMAASSTALYASFTGAGLYKWDGTAWSRIDKGIPANMAASSSALYASFTGAGLYKWDGTAWSRIDKGVPTSMAVSGPVLYATFTGAGVYKWNGTAWSRIDKSVPTLMASAQ
ncbi:MAG: multicopper oxidase [Thermodesulfobacteriota bacterium]